MLRQATVIVILPRSSTMDFPALHNTRSITRVHEQPIVRIQPIWNASRKNSSECPANDPSRSASEIDVRVPLILIGMERLVVCLSFTPMNIFFRSVSLFIAAPKILGWYRCNNLTSGFSALPCDNTLSLLCHSNFTCQCPNTMFWNINDQICGMRNEANRIFIQVFIE